MFVQNVYILGLFATSISRTPHITASANGTVSANGNSSTLTLPILAAAIDRSWCDCRCISSQNFHSIREKCIPHFRTLPCVYSSRWKEPSPWHINRFCVHVTGQNRLWSETLVTLKSWKLVWRSSYTPFLHVLNTPLLLAHMNGYTQVNHSASLGLWIWIWWPQIYWIYGINILSRLKLTSSQ